MCLYEFTHYLDKSFKMIFPKQSVLVKFHAPAYKFSKK